MDGRYSAWLRENRIELGMQTRAPHTEDLFEYAYSDQGNVHADDVPPRGGFLRPGSRLVQRLKERRNA